MKKMYKTHKQIFLIIFLALCCNGGTSLFATTDSIHHAIELELVNLYKGTMTLHYDLKVNPSFSLRLEASGTYASKRGIARTYLENTDLSFGGFWYTPEMLTGFSAGLQARHYLRYKHTTLTGLYAGGFLKYRKVNIITPTWVSEDVHIRGLDIYQSGVFIGKRWGLLKNSISIDVFAGAGLRLSKYTDEKHFTRFNDWKALDYSGILPTGGFSVGILK